VGARFSAPVQTGPGAQPASCKMGTGSFPGVKSGRGDTNPSSPSSAIGHEKVELYLYSPYAPHGLYRASASVQGCTLTFHLSVSCSHYAKSITAMRFVTINMLNTIQTRNFIINSGQSFKNNIHKAGANRGTSR
jgi:hypothetical protein